MTFFEGEIISKEHPFLTRKWVSIFSRVNNGRVNYCFPKEADAGVDKDHWVGTVEPSHGLSMSFFFSQGKFSGFKNFSSRFNDDSFSYDEVEKSDFIFMRWKVSFECSIYDVTFLIVLS